MTGCLRRSTFLSKNSWCLPNPLKGFSSAAGKPAYRAEQGGRSGRLEAKVLVKPGRSVGTHRKVDQNFAISVRGPVYSMASIQDPGHERLPAATALPRQIARRFWQPDADADRCSIHHCDRIFSWTRGRRHHCRQCGRVVCEACSRGQVVSRPIKSL